MKIYISIPISGHSIEEQKEKAKYIAERLKALGHEPVNPFDTPPPSGNLSDKEQYAYYIGEDLKRLLTCDAAFFCEDWLKSKGCRLEYHVASLYGIKRCSTYQSIANSHE